MGLDFIQRDDGKLFAIECNPRATSGIHLFRDQPEFAGLFFQPEKRPGSPLMANLRRPAMHALPMLLWALGNVRSHQDASRWARQFFSGRDIVSSWTDPLPLLLLSFSIATLHGRCRKHSITADQASTLDIEWNGE